MITTGLLTLLAVACGELPAAPTAEYAPAAAGAMAATAASVTITPVADTLLVGDTVRLKASNLSGRRRWSSDAPTVATVTDGGLVRGVSAGTAHVTVSSSVGSATSVITVTAPTPPAPLPVARVTITPATSTLAVGGSAQLSAVAVDANGTVLSEPLQWVSSNPAVAIVSSTGFVNALAAGSSTVTATATNGVVGQSSITVSAPDTATTPPTPVAAPRGIWISPSELAALPASGAAWSAMLSTANSDCGAVQLNNQDQNNNVCIMAKALVYARIGGAGYRDAVVAAIRSIVNSGTYSGQALALGRELAAYVISADLVNLAAVDPTLDGQFRGKLRELRTTFTSSGPASLILCHEQRPNNWGTHCGASRVAVAAYLDDQAELDRAAKVFMGWLGDRSSYAGFSYGSDLTWQCNPASPVGINPAGCMKNGNPIDGVLPDDQRRGGSFTWPPPQENYVYEALQGALAQAVLLSRRGYNVWSAQNQALLRAFKWLHTYANYPAAGDDRWEPHVVNRIYGTSFPAQVPAQPGKNVGWTDWTHQ